MEIIQVEHCNFESDAITFWLDISGVPQSIQEEAQQIDGNNFDPDCFGICVTYVLEERRFYVVVDTELSVKHPGNIYYAGIDGEKYWFAAELPESFVKQLFLACTEATANESYNIKPTKQDAEQSVAQMLAEMG